MMAAEDAFRRAFLVDSNYPLASSNLAFLLMNQGKLQEACTLADQVKESKGNRIGPQVYFNLGVIYAKGGHLEKAIENYQKAVALSDPYPEAYFNLGLLYQQVGNVSAAQASFERFLAQWKGNPASPFVLEAVRSLKKLKER